MCWVQEGCSSLKPAACSSLPLEVLDSVDFDAAALNLHLNKGCYTHEKVPLQNQLNNAPASCNPPCFRITKPGEYCYMSTRNNNFSNRRHMGQITVIVVSQLSFAYLPLQKHGVLEAFEIIWVGEEKKFKFQQHERKKILFPTSLLFQSLLTSGEN